MPYLMGGYPDAETSRRIVAAYVEGGADLIELGVPFSDPLADGPVIHAAGIAALRTGVSLAHVLEIARSVGEQVPVVVMCYSNVILARGLERFADALLGAGVSGLIVPDLPLEEAPSTRAVCDPRGLALVPLVAPTTPDDRMRRIGATARGFVYAVSLLGTTGERAALDGGVQRLVDRARSGTDIPIAVGFGIGSPEQAAATASAGADGVIIGSRLVRAAGESADPPAAVRELVREFSRALR
jgi:tryptophan synthase alpha chain